MELFRHHLDAEQVHQIQAVLNGELALENEVSKDKIERMLARQTRPRKLGRPGGKESR